MEHEGDLCVICLCAIDENTYCELSPCAHTFHSRCIQQWLTNKQTCPVCRSPETACQHDSIVDHSQHVLVGIIEAQSMHIVSLTNDMNTMADGIVALRLRMQLLASDLEERNQQDTMLGIILASYE